MARGSNPAVGADSSRDSLPTLHIKRKRVAIPLVSTLVIASAVVMTYVARKVVPEVDDLLIGLGSWGPAAFLGVYVLGILVFAPASLFCLVAGALFGLWWGTLWAMVGGVVASIAAFLVARTGARSWLEDKLRSMPTLDKLDDAVSRDGLKLLFLIRLSPIMPMSVVSYAMGLSRVRLRSFVASSPAMLPGLLPYVYGGKVAGDLVQYATGNLEKPWWEWAILAVGLAATAVAAWLVTRRAKRALERA